MPSFWASLSRPTKLITTWYNSIAEILMSVRVLQSLWRDSNGSALVEGAILVPLLLTLMLGVYEFSWLIDQQHLIAAGINDAARYIARSANPNDLTIQRAAKNLATTGAIDGNTARVRGWTARDVNITYASVKNEVDSDGLTLFRGGAVIQKVTESHTFPRPPIGF